MSLWRKTTQQKTDTELMLLLRKGGKGAFPVLYARYADKLVRFFFRMLNQDNEKAQDFMHDLFVKIIENPSLYDPSRRFDTWLFHIAYNMCKNEYRKMTVREEFLIRQTTGEVHYEETGFSRIDHREFSEALNQKLGLMDEKQRTVFLLRYQQELSLKEIAEILECPEGTVKSRLFYAIRFLSEKLTVFDPKVN